MNRLIICSPQLGIAPESNSGGEVHDREVIRSFCKQGIKVIVILPKNKSYLPHKNLKVYYLPLPFIWPPYLFNILIIPHLFWLYKKYKFNILRVHSPYFVGLGAWFFKLFHPKIPLVVTYHHLEEQKPFFDLINRFFINCWDYIICVSRFTKKEINKNYKVDKKKISVVYNGIADYFKPKKKREDLIEKYSLENKKVCLFLGGLKQRKNVGFLLKVMTRIKLPNVKLLIGGGGGLYKKLNNQAKKLWIQDKVIFPGFIPENEKVDYYNLADIFLFASKKEGFGMPVIEAAACGIPTVASDVSSLKELIIDGKTGYLVRLNDLDDWKKKIEKLLKNDNLRKKMAKAAQKFSQKFSWNTNIRKQIKIYKKLLEVRN